MSGLPRSFSIVRHARLTLYVALSLAVILLTAARIQFAATEPFWFDEAFSLAIVSRPDWATFWREVYLDSNGPAYYLLLRLWGDVFGTSDFALRIPSLLAVLAAGAMPLLARPKTLSRDAAVAWAALIFAWWGVGDFLDARCYAILLAVTTAQTLAFARLLERPGPGRAAAWATLAAAGILLHYYATFLGLAQGLIYLAWRRGAAMRTWPAALIFIPAFGWIAHHAPRLEAYSRLARVWHRPTDADFLAGLPQFAINPSSPFALAAVTGILLAGWLLARRSPGSAAEPPQTVGVLALTAGAGVLAFALMLGFALSGSGISPRYLVPVVPSLLLGLVLLAGRRPSARFTYVGLAALYFGLQIQPAFATLSAPQPRPRYEFETASAWLMDRQISDLVFVWDHELTPIMATTTLTSVGGVFFQRAGRAVRVEPLVERPGRDPNLDIAEAARGPRPGVIWLFNRDGHTAAHDVAPALEARNPGWRCRPGGESDRVGAVACYRLPLRP